MPLAMTAPVSFKTLNQYVDTAFLTRLFGRSSLTVLLWRQKKGLPYLRIPGEGRDVIRYDKREVLAWAKIHRVRIRAIKELT